MADLMKWRAARRRKEPSGFLLPDSLDESPRRLKSGDTWCQTFAVAGFPREVAPGWLAPLLDYSGPVDVSFHIEPIPNDVAASNLKRQIARLESTRRIDESKLRLVDAELEAAAEDAKELAGGIARGEGKLFRVGLYITIRSSSEELLEAEVTKVRSLAASLLLDPRPLSFRQVEGWLSTLPVGIDGVRLRRTFDTRALASCFPFGSAEFSHEKGVLCGLNSSTGGPVFLDRFALENHNQVVLARSGAGKSFFAKLFLLRSLYQGIEVLVIDPENEYRRRWGRRRNRYPAREKGLTLQSVRPTSTRNPRLAAGTCAVPSHPDSNACRSALGGGEGGARPVLAEGLRQRWDDV